MRAPTKRLPGLALVLLLCGNGIPMSLAQTAADASAPAAGAVAPDASAEAAPARAFIERSLVIAPEQVGKFSLVGLNDFPGNPGSGIGARYQHVDFPGVRVDVFVYPTGRKSRSRELADEMDFVRQGIEQAGSDGKYTDVQVDAPAPFDLGRVDEDGSLRPRPMPDPSAEAPLDDEDPVRVVARAKPEADYRRGLRMTARLTMRDAPQNSRAFVFYRGLYLIKGRISASPLTLPEEAFDRFANHAMAVLVPAMTVRSTGGCYPLDVSVDQGSSEAQLAAALTTADEIRTQEACSETLDESVPAGHRALPLVYTPEMWN